MKQTPPPEPVRGHVDLSGAEIAPSEPAFQLSLTGGDPGRQPEIDLETLEIRRRADIAQAAQRAPIDRRPQVFRPVSFFHGHSHCIGGDRPARTHTYAVGDGHDPGYFRSWWNQTDRKSVV